MRSLFSSIRVFFFLLFDFFPQFSSSLNGGLADCLNHALLLGGGVFGSRHVFFSICTSDGRSGYRRFIVHYRCLSAPSRFLPSYSPPRGGQEMGLFHRHGSLWQSLGSRGYLDFFFVSTYVFSLFPPCRNQLLPVSFPHEGAPPRNIGSHFGGLQ